MKNILKQQKLKLKGWGIVVNVADQLGAYWRVIDEARKKVPVVNFALAVAALSACGAISLFFLGDKRTAIITTGLVFIGAILIFVFSRMAAENKSLLAAQVLLWSTIVFFVSFLGLTISAYATGKPCNWARFIGAVSECEKLASEKGCTSIETSAWRSIDRQFCTDALNLANELVKRCPHHADNYNALGAAHYCLGNWEAALDNWREAIRQNPADPRYKRNGGAALIRLGRLDEAVRLHKALYEENRNNLRFDASTIYNYALSLLLAGSYEDAKKRFRELLETRFRGQKVSRVLLMRS